MPQEEDFSDINTFCLNDKPMQKQGKVIFQLYNGF